MAALEDHLGRPLKDTVGNPIKNGSTVIDLMFGIARGTVRLEKGDGVNFLHCLVRNRGAADKSMSRGAENLTLKGAGGFRTTSIVTGAEFESGAANRARGVNDAEAVQMRTVRDALLWCIAGCVITGVM